MIVKYCFASLLIAASIAIGEVTVKDIPLPAASTSSETPVKVQTISVNDILAVDVPPKQEILVGLNVRDPGGALLANRANIEIKEAHDNVGNILKKADTRTINFWLSPRIDNDNAQLSLTGYGATATTISVTGELVFHKVTRSEEVLIRPINAPQRVKIGELDVDIGAPERKGGGWKITIKGKRPATMSVDSFKRNYDMLCAAEISLSTDSGFSYRYTGGGGSRGDNDFDNTAEMKPDSTASDPANPPEPTRLTIKRVAETAEVRLPLKLEQVKLP